VLPPSAQPLLRRQMGPEGPLPRPLGRGRAPGAGSGGIRSRVLREIREHFGRQQQQVGVDPDEQAQQLGQAAAAPLALQVGLQGGGPRLRDRAAEVGDEVGQARHRAVKTGRRRFRLGPGGHQVPVNRQGQIGLGGLAERTAEGVEDPGGLEADGQIQLLGGLQQGNPADLPQIHPHRVLGQLRTPPFAQGLDLLLDGFALDLLQLRFLGLLREWLLRDPLFLFFQDPLLFLQPLLLEAPRLFVLPRWLSHSHPLPSHSLRQTGGGRDPCSRAP